MTVSAIGSSSETLSWTAATDDKTAPADLLYLAYSSTSNVMNTLAAVEANGTPSGTFTAAITQRQITGLRGGTPYYFNVVVKDAAGNKAVYAGAAGTTLPSPIFVFAADPIQVPFTSVAARAACSAKRTTAHSALDCSQTVPLLSYSTAPIGTLPATAGLPADRALVGPTGAKFGNNLADVLDNSISLSMSAAGIITTSYWTGSVKDGTTSDNCVNWSDISGFGSLAGDPLSITGGWLDGSLLGCGAPLPFLCACWQP